MTSDPSSCHREYSPYGLYSLFQTACFLINFGNRKRWNGGIVNGMQQFFGIGITGRVFYLFRPFHLREWNRWKSMDSWNSGDRFRWTLDFIPE